MGRVFRHFLSVVGFLSLVPALFRAIKWIVGLFGDFDFIISRSDEPGWLVPMVNWLLSPPDWAIFASLVVGFALIWADIKRPWQRWFTGPSALFIENQFSAFPTVVPLDGQIATMRFDWAPSWHKTVWANSTRHGTPGEKWNWDHVSERPYLVRIINLSDAPMFKVQIFFTADFRENIIDGTSQRSGNSLHQATFQVVIDSLFPGKENAYTAYAYSSCPYCVFVTPPLEATYQTAAAGTRRKTSIMLPRLWIMDFLPPRTAPPARQEPPSTAIEKPQ
jgi:hypothetical protein